MAKGLDALLIAAGPPKLDKGRGESGGKMDEESDDGSAEERAFLRFASAAKAGDAKAGVAAYRALKDACEANEGEPSDSDYADEGDEGES